MLFSVIIPVYNVEKYLKECLDSLVKQTYSDYEVILINDGSRDASGGICDEYAKQYEKIRVIHQENAGAACARNAGVKVAQGKYIVFLDSDDYILDDRFLDILSKKCYENSDVILYGYQKFFDSNQSFGSKVCHYPEIKDVKEPGLIIKRLLEADMYDGSPWGKALRTEFLKSYKIEFVPGMISEDSDWYLQVVSQAQTYETINEAFIAYRQREGSISHAPKVKSLTDNIGMLERWEQQIEELDLAVTLKDSLMAILARYYGNVLILYACYSNKEVGQYYKQLKELCHLLKYSVTTRSKIIKCTSRILGLRVTIFLLAMLGKIIRRV